MGFSVSGSAALVFAALFVAFGVWHGAATESFERVSDAREARADDALDERNTDLRIDTARYAGGTLVVRATNTGSVALSLNATDVVVDNAYRTDWQADAEIDDRTLATDLWLPGETVNATFATGGPPDRVTVATENGVADAREVSS